MRAVVLLLFLACNCFGFGTNRVPNSSFECGVGRGYASWNTANNAIEGEEYFITEQLTNVAWHGKYGYKLVPGEDFITRSMELTNGTYISSVYAKTVDGGTTTANYAFIIGLVHTTNIINFDYLANDKPSINGTWTRYFVTNVITETDFYVLQLGTVHPAGVIIDSIQVELASTAPTTYAPMAEVELGIGVKGTYGMWHSDSGHPSFDLNFRNEGTTMTNVRASYEVRNLWNSNALAFTRSYTIPPGTNTNFVVNLPTNTVSGLPMTGSFRVKTRLAAFPDSADEVKMNVYPFASTATNNWLGGHPHPTHYMSRREMLAGRRIARNLSVNNQNTRWWGTVAGLHVEDTRGNMVFLPEASFTNWYNNGLLALGCLTPMDGMWPSWAYVTNAPGFTYHTNTLFPREGMWDGMAWSNFCYHAVRTNKQHVRYWEIGPNEPYQSGPYGDGLETDPDNLPINTRIPTNYAKVFKFGLDGATNADPTAKFICIAGAFGNGDWAWEVWTNLSANIQSWVYAVSTHHYTYDQNENPNYPFLIGIDNPQTHLPMGWMDRFKGIRPVWNTESSATGVDYYQGMNALWRHDWWTDFYGARGWAEAARNEQSSRQVTGVTRMMTTILKCIGFGFDKYFYYDTRYFNDENFKWATATTPAIVGFIYAVDQMEIDKPEVVSASVATHFIGAPGYGPISNVVANVDHSKRMEMYIFPGAPDGPWAGGYVISAWAADRTNRTLTLDNAHFAQFDVMGNLIATNSLTAQITRVPRYFATTARTLVQFSNTFRTATHTLDPDVLPPQVSVEIAPTGEWNGSTNRQYIRWIAIDDVAVAFATHARSDHTNAITKTNVVYQWKLNGGTYTNPSESNHVWLSQIPAGTNTFWVKATDNVGNYSEVPYLFVPDEDPLLPPSNLNVRDTANIGTITVP